ALFGSMGGGWREQYVIPVLRQLGVSYFDPNFNRDWTPDMGVREAEVMANCETIVMVINMERPAFSSLAETGWAALGAVQRGQHFILQIDLDYQINLPDSLNNDEESQSFGRLLQHYGHASRDLVVKHARQFHIPTLHIVDDISGVINVLHGIYSKTPVG
ncbi:MAG: hypothetical protein KF726_09995, partial [Anaerolineae bacterium]|nr:hypothetical protein [Anaerolineae bacterium]